MTRRIKRHRDFELNLTIKDDAFLKTPRNAQRNWLLNRTVRELSEELLHLDTLTPAMVKGSDEVIELDRASGSHADEDIMEDWQIPVMKAMAEAVSFKDGEILEIGMGRGVASSLIQKHNPLTHTIIECNKTIAQTFDEWKKTYPDKNIQLIHSMWQDCLDRLGTYDGILFHTYPMSETEFVDTVVKDVTFAAHFFATAGKLLKPGGSLTYLTNEFDSLSRAHQRALFEHFSEFKLSLVEDLDIPDSTRDALWVRQMVIVKAVK